MFSSYLVIIKLSILDMIIWKLFSCQNNGYIVVAHVPSFHISAGSSPFFLHLLFTFMENPLRKHPISPWILSLRLPLLLLSPCSNDQHNPHLLPPFFSNYESKVSPWKHICVPNLKVTLFFLRWATTFQNTIKYIILFPISISVFPISRSVLLYYLSTIAGPRPSCWEHLAYPRPFFWENLANPRPFFWELPTSFCLCSTPFLQ